MPPFLPLLLCSKIPSSGSKSQEAKVSGLSARLQNDKHGGIRRGLHHRYPWIFAFIVIGAPLMTGCLGPSRNGGTAMRKIEAGDYAVSISEKGAVRSIEKKGAGGDRRGWRLGDRRQAKRTSGTFGTVGAGEIILGDQTFELSSPSGTE